MNAHIDPLRRQQSGASMDAPYGGKRVAIVACLALAQFISLAHADEAGIASANTKVTVQTETGVSKSMSSSTPRPEIAAILAKVDRTLKLNGHPTLIDGQANRPRTRVPMVSTSVEFVRDGHLYSQADKMDFEFDQLVAEFYFDLEAENDTTVGFMIFRDEKGVVFRLIEGNNETSYLDIDSTREALILEFFGRPVPFDPNTPPYGSPPGTYPEAVHDEDDK